ncbi:MULTISPECIES: zinc-dependent alcohol dehydrogenase [unclassified Caballeronia]|uniref:zinc-dependent alcohol dehydrogenase n=1 Tax=unclassified Caballeronia TaxID=2646786 RepID=UPI00285FDBE6|nr:MULTISPECIES: zinc-dependent alcohol dehydrogenase [unclassified Caballeronia]MDR5763090.1 glutathione-dependent formaldehyde dehydrogenase [Caballeronia sp. LZ035]MDR5883925.1 glutathione-dependent formaldehyde dehydrogenase [Caballeronia sp. LZ032]
MKAVVFHGVGNISLDNVPDPSIQHDQDAIVRLTASAVCGTDLHMVRGTLGGMKPGTILGHEGVGVIEEIGKGVRNFKRGDRVLIPSTISCGFCSYCRKGYTAQCDEANPNGPAAGTAFFGGPQSTGPFNGLQAQFARTPLANASLIRLPENIDDERAILMSDIFPTGFFGAQLAEVTRGDTVAVFGAGPVGQFAVASAFMLGAGRVIVVDRLQDRLDMARAQGAEAVNFDEEDPVQAILELTGGIGVDRAIDAVGVDSVHAQAGPASSEDSAKQGESESETVTPERNMSDGNWIPGDAPTQALDWSIAAVAKAGTLGIIGVYPPNDRFFPIGVAMNKNLTIKMGNCNHRAVTPPLVERVRSGSFDPLRVLTTREPLMNVIDAYKAFDKRQPGWIKVALEPVA